MKPISIVPSVLLLLASCAGKEHAPLLTGDIAANDSVMITAYYDIDGDIYLDEFFTDSVGHFTFDPSIPSGTDLTLYINGTSYGVRLENGTTSNITIDSLGEATFTGANIAESKWLTECFKGYDTRRYKHIIARDGAYDPAKYNDMLESTRVMTAKLLPDVSNDSLRAYYGRLGDQFYNRTKGNILMSDYYYNHRDSGEEMPAEYHELMTADPNGDEARRTGALYEWLHTIPTVREGGLLVVINAMCDSIDKKITNPANKRMLFNSCSDMLFSYNMSVDDIRTFISGMGDRLSPHQLEVLSDKISEIEKRTKDGDKIPCDPVLVMPDGSKKSLTEACEGKVAYIDMWATWCGPCCAQIPYMEKMAEYYKNNDKVVCISVSCDEDLEAWHRKLDQDKPEWPQYVFSGESGQQFMTSLGVNGIPRFIIINPDMTIANIDAPRPQNDAQVKEIIDALIAAK